MISRRWGHRTGVQWFDIYTRCSLYLLSATEPLVALLLVGSEPQVRPWGALAMVLVVLLHTASCVRVLRAAIDHHLGAAALPRRLVGVAVALTVLGLGTAAVTLRAEPVEGVTFPLGVTALGMAATLCAGLSIAVAPLLRVVPLTAVIVVPAAVGAGVAVLGSGNSVGPAVWALLYLVGVGPIVITSRLAVWFLGVVWQIERSRAVEARLAVAEERLRVARDLHDVLGRNLAIISVNSELAAQLTRHGRDGAVERMVQIHQIAQDSMREVREVVGGRRDADLESELAGARSVLQSAGIHARVIGEDPGLPTSVQAALGWVVREATTNIIRHADATTARIELDVVARAAGPAARLQIENDGVRSDQPGERTGILSDVLDPGHGTGLAGLRERLASIGGELTAAPMPGGRFRVQALLPFVLAEPGARAQPPARGKSDSSAAPTAAEVRS